jgi:hypothetical protein|tara:strand:+ start:301 stop:438 length:138 start_codon:yes stop_codon:yes gene_type:complete
MLTLLIFTMAMLAMTTLARANMVVTASTIRYRREIRCWQRFAVVR